MATVDRSVTTAGASATVTAPHAQPASAPDDAAVVSERRALMDKASVSRSASRPASVAVQRAIQSRALTVSQQAVTGRVNESVAPADPRDIAMIMLADYGWTDQYACLDQLYISESNWNPYAENPTSGAYGIPQSLPAEKMATAALTGVPTRRLSWSGGSTTSRPAMELPAAPGTSSRPTTGTDRISRAA